MAQLYKDYLKILELAMDLRKARRRFKTLVESKTGYLPHKLSKNVISFSDGSYEWISHQKIYTDAERSYQAFSKNRQVLRKIAVKEIESGRFLQGRVNFDVNEKGEYTLWLYCGGKNENRS